MISRPFKAKLSLRQLREAIFYLLAWLPALVVSLQAQRTVLSSDGGGFELEAEIRGLSGVTELGNIDRLAMFRGDLALLAIAIPMVGLLVLPRLPKSLRPWIVLVVTWIVTLTVYVEMKCYWEVGAFLPLSVLVAGLSSANRGLVTDYLEVGSTLKLAAVMGFTAVWCVLGYRVRSDSLRSALFGARRTALTAAGLVGFFTMAGLRVAPKTNPYNRSIALAATEALVRSDNSSVPILGTDSLPPLPLLAQYHALVESNTSGASTDAHGVASGMDVLVFVLETAPQVCLDKFARDGLLPNLEALKRESFVGRQHYSTYPYTTRAIFSIYSGLYPSTFSFDFIRSLDTPRRSSPLFVPGFVQAAATNGYDTRIFVPESPGKNWEHDQERYEALGFHAVVWPGTISRTQSDDLTTIAIAKEKRRFVDSLLFNQLFLALDSATARQRSYLFAIHPQYTHGPWAEASTAGQSIDATCASGADQFGQVDSWIGQTMTRLRTSHRLDKTVVLVTGDHGIRTRTEHPGFRGGTIGAISYHVPLILRVPGLTVERASLSESVTSHIDISPTIADLMGWSECRWAEQGAPVWSLPASRRTTMFLGRSYLGADGFIRGDSLFMMKYALGAAASRAWNDTLSFDASTLRKDPSAGAVRAYIDSLTKIQVRLANSFATGAFRTNCAAPSM